MPLRKLRIAEPEPESTSATLRAELVARSAILRDLESADAKLAEDLEAAYIDGTLEDVRRIKAVQADNEDRRIMTQRQARDLRERFAHMKAAEDAILVAECREAWAKVTKSLPAAYLALCEVFQPLLDIKRRLDVADLRMVSAEFELPPVIAIDLSKIGGTSPCVQPPDVLWHWADRQDKLVARWKKESAS